MKHAYQDNVKPFLHDQITKTAKELNLTKEEIAEILAIDSRSYAYLKSGQSMCSATTLLVYLTKLCPDPMQFIEDAKDIIDEAEQNR